MNQAAEAWAAEAKERNAASLAKWSPPEKPPRKYYSYTVEDNPEVYGFTSNLLPSAGAWLAEEAAENIFNFHDGWEFHWPVKITVSSDDGVVGTYSVDMHAEPVFSASEVE